MFQWDRNIYFRKGFIDSQYFNLIAINHKVCFIYYSQYRDQWSSDFADDDGMNYVPVTANLSTI